MPMFISAFGAGSLWPYAMRVHANWHFIKADQGAAFFNYESTHLMCIFAQFYIHKLLKVYIRRRTCGARSGSGFGL